ncbi:MAG: NnrU family protein, partial [Burkholderiaceae bacterium]
VWGYGLTRQAPVELWSPPVWTRHIAALLMLVSFVLLAASYVPGTRIKAAVHHPMVLGTKVWAFAHLVSNGRLADMVLFGAFLVWSIVLYAASRRRDRRLGTRYIAGPASRDVIAIVVGAALYGAFAFWLHGLLIGVMPFG